MSILISGSITYDTILRFSGNFKDQIVGKTSDKLTTSFEIDSMHRDFGGCAANIAYALKLLGGDPIVWGALGTDGDDYKNRFEALGIKTCLHTSEKNLTAQCFITVDACGNQLTSFASNAMKEVTDTPWPENEHISMALLGPEVAEATLQKKELLVKHGVDYIFDPGQTIPQFTSEELFDLATTAKLVIVNDYEKELLKAKLHFDDNELLKTVRQMLVTEGKDGSTYYKSGEPILHVDAITAESVNPVGAGDAYRGGWLFASDKKWPVKKAMEIGSALAACKIQTQGSQSYQTDLEEILGKVLLFYG